MIYNELDLNQNINSEALEGNSQNHQPKFNSFAYLCSQLSWFVFILIFIGSGFLFQRYHPSNIYRSAPIENAWNSSLDPLIFTHTADIHISVTEPDKITSARALIHTMQFFKANINFITGDIVNSYSKKSPPKIGHQFEDDWKKWRSIIEEETQSSRFPIIDLPGNHDMFGIDKAIGPHNLYLDYSFTFNRTNTKTVRDLNVRTIKIFNLTFLLINPIRFPYPAPPYAYWTHPTKKMLDEIESEIDQIPAQNFYVFSHFPIDHSWWIKSSRGHSYEEIMQNERIIAYFTGHFHPKDTEIIHHKKGATEFIVAAAYQFKKFGLITIDNDRLVYHSVDLTSPPLKYVLTNPIPVEQLSNHQKFSEKDTELRLISYDSEIGNETVLTVSGAVEGVMKYERTLPNGAALFSFPLHIEKEGIYTVNISGKKCQITRRFYVGPSFKSSKDVACCYQRGLLFVKIASIPIFTCLFWILFPFDCLFENFSQMTNKDIESDTLDVKEWLAIIFLSPSILHQRMSRLPKSLRVMLFVFLFYPIFFPQNFFKTIFGLHGCPILCFIIIGNEIFYDEWAIHMTMFFLLLILMPAVFILSSAKLYFEKNWIFYLNAFIAAVFFCGASVVNMRFVGESAVVPNLFLNPTLVIIPAFIYLTAYTKIFVRDEYVDYSEMADNVLSYTK